MVCSLIMEEDGPITGGFSPGNCVVGGCNTFGISRLKIPSNKYSTLPSQEWRNGMLLFMNLLGDKVEPLGTNQILLNLVYVPYMEHSLGVQDIPKGLKFNF